MSRTLQQPAFLVIFLMVALLATACAAAQTPTDGTLPDASGTEMPASDNEEAVGTAPDAITMPLQPLSEEACEELSDALAQTLNVEIAASEAPFDDFMADEQGTGCLLAAEGTGEDFRGHVEVAGSVQRMFQSLGWTEDTQYIADGPTGTASAYRRGNELSLVTVSWTPSPDADCPDDQPIFACELEPEQRLFTITVNSARR